MKGDFSRFTFRPDRRYSGVYMQQGRAELDSDWNEQTSITTAALRALARDLIGPHGGAEGGFAISPRTDTAGRAEPWDFTVGAGSYYVDGIRCKNLAPLSYRAATGALGCVEDSLEEPGSYLAYLEVWDRHVTATEDPDLLEPALGGMDTSTRLQVVWRVRLLALDRPSEVAAGSREPERILARAFPPGDSRASARVDDGGFRGPENHLYRVEINAGGKQDEATFMWSRDNGSVVAPVLAVEADRVVIDPRLTRSAERGFGVGSWIQPEDDVASHCDGTPPLLRIEAIEDEGRLVTAPSWPLGAPDPTMHPVIRRWDHSIAGDPGRGGAIPLQEGQWIDLEDGIQIAFGKGGDYRDGDYWVIPARFTARNIEWPSEVGGPAPRPPYRVERHRAPLAHVTFDREGAARVTRDYRRVFRVMGDRP